MSPSSTPEPSCAAAIPPHLMYHGNVPFGMLKLQNTNMSHLMTLQAPFFYPTDSSEDLYSMLQHNSNPLYPSIL
jgi:hypothetical protein